MAIVIVLFFCYLYCDHRDLHVRTHSFPTRRSSDLIWRTASSLRSATSGRTATEETTSAARASFGRLSKLCARWCRERSEEHTSELQSLMRISYAVFCLKKKKNKQQHPHHTSI